MAFIDKRKTSKGEVRYHVRYRGPDGRERSKTFRSRKDADRFETTVRASLLHGTFVDPAAGRVALAPYARQWMQERPKPLRIRTLDTYSTLLRLHIEPALGDIPLSKITPSVVRRWHAGLVHDGPGANTAAKAYRLLHAVMATAVADELISRNPCVIKGAGIERSDERPVATVEQVWAAADAMPDRYRCLVLLAGFAGLRRGELLGLECRHLNLLHGTVTVDQQQQELPNGSVVLVEPKTDAGKRTLSLPSVLVDELQEHLVHFSTPHAGGRVFAGEKGGPLRALTVYKYWTHARRAAGLPDGFRLHDLRHTANTLTAASGASTRELMHRMGHASSSAALRYQHATQDRDAALALALSGLVKRSRPVATRAADDAS